MDKKDLIPVFNEMLRKAFNEQKDRKIKKYVEQRCCTEEEVQAFTETFKELLNYRERIDFDSFLKIFGFEEEL
jgi:hypothetical protein